MAGSSPSRFTPEILGLIHSARGNNPVLAYG